ncbi:MAG: lipopolysaccharide heptosyltransferase I [Desulfuromonadales bacterium]|nr:lipopolysaccharide heptosyltransferase I [Desulfuromonadales bacterium]
MKVLIVKTSALGDVVHALPVLAWLHSADPALQIDWLVERGFAPLLDDHPLLRQTIAIDTRGWRRQGRLTALRQGWRVLRRIRREGYDVVLDLQGNSKSGLFTFLSGATRRYGFAHGAVREWPNLLATNHKVKPGEEAFHITDRSLAIARAAFPNGSELLPAGPLPVAAVARESVARQLAEFGLDRQPVVVLHYGTTWSTKLWALDSWQELAGRLNAEQSIRPVLTWGSEVERQAVQTIAAACRQQCHIWPRGSLKELIALLARADLVVGGDTGPVHIAAAVGTPTVSLFRVTDASRNAPRGAVHISLSARLECSPCLRKTCERDDECAASIAVDQVFQAVVHALQAH